MNKNKNKNSKGGNACNNVRNNTDNTEKPATEKKQNCGNTKNNKKQLMVGSHANAESTTTTAATTKLASKPTALATFAS